MSSCTGTSCGKTWRPCWYQQQCLTVGPCFIGYLISIRSLVVHAQVVKILLETGSDVSSLDNDRDTALHAATSQGHTEIVRLLLDAGADPSAANRNDMTPLESAERRDYKEVVGLLVAHGGTAKENQATARSYLPNAAKAKMRSVAFGGQHKQPSSNQTWVPEELECASSGPEGWCCGNVGADRRG